MNILKYLLLSLWFIGMYGCNNISKTAENKEEENPAKPYEPIVIKPDTLIYVVLDDSLREEVRKRGKKMAYTTQMALKKELQAAIKAGGPAHAVAFCNTRAMQITDSVSLANGVGIKRLAKKNRNPLNAMDENESNLYKSYVLEFINGAPPHETILWNEQGNPVYYYPMYVDALCLNCHGTVGKEILPEVAETIAKLYPEDLATDFKEGDPRGMWSVTFPEYRITDVK